VSSEQVWAEMLCARNASGTLNPEEVMPVPRGRLVRIRRVGNSVRLNGGGPYEVLAESPIGVWVLPDASCRKGEEGPPFFLLHDHLAQGKPPAKKEKWGGVMSKKAARDLSRDLLFAGDCAWPPTRCLPEVARFTTIRLTGAGQSPCRCH
jgi:hypothetical protein